MTNVGTNAWDKAGEYEGDSVKELWASAHGVGVLTDSKVAKLVFPSSDVRPFAVRSYTNLVLFVEDPLRAEKEGRCLPGARAAWESMLEENRQTIVARIGFLQQHFPELMYSIVTLKAISAYSFVVHDVKMTLKFFNMADPTIADAIKICLSVKDDVFAADVSTVEK